MSRKSAPKPQLGWLDTLDIPAIPDFADPSFNPYIYDGADDWFATRRETFTRSEMDLMTCQASFYGADTTQANLSLQEVPSRSLSSMSLQENCSMPRENRPAAGRARKPFMSIKSNQIQPVNLPAKKPIIPTIVKVAAPLAGPVVSVSHPSSPPKPMTKLPPPPAAAIRRTAPLRIPSHAPEKAALHSHLPSSNVASNGNVPYLHGRIDLANKRRPTAVNPVHHNLPPSNVFQFRRAEEKDSDVTRRRSVEAARAGEYFAHILRAYPEEAGKVKNTCIWK